MSKVQEGGRQKLTRAYKAARKARRKNTTDTKFRVSSVNMHAHGVRTLKDGVEVFASRYMQAYTEIRKEGVNKAVAHRLAMVTVSVTEAVQGVYERYPVQGNATNLLSMCTELWLAVNDPGYLEAAHNDTLDDLLRKRAEEAAE